MSDEDGPESTGLVRHWGVNEFCTKCGRRFPRDQLTVKHAMFQTYEKPRKTKKTVTMAKLCPTCLEEDPEWKSAPKWATGERKKPVKKKR